MSGIGTDALAELDAAVDARADEIVALTRTLIERPSENPPGDERAAVEAVRAALADLPDVELRVVEGAPKRASLIASAGPRGTRSLLLGAHLDTVPAGTGWTRTALAGTLEDGRIYGRGSTDNKGAAAAMVAAFRTLVERGTPGRLILVANADEETGSRFGMDHVRDVLGEPVDAAVIAEPSGIAEPFERLWVAARGSCRFTITTGGTETHTSLMREAGVRSALADLLALIAALEQAMALLRAPGEDGYAVAELIVSELHGGRGWAIVPAAATAKLELRVTAAVSRAELEAALLAAFETAQAQTGAQATLTFAEGTQRWIAPSRVDPSEPIVAAATRAWRECLGREPVLGTFPGGTDAKSLTERSIPAVPGIGPGALRRAHGPDEYVEIAELVTAARLYARTAAHFLGVEEVGT